MPVVSIFHRNKGVVAAFLMHMPILEEYDVIRQCDRRQAMVNDNNESMPGNLLKRGNKRCLSLGHGPCSDRGAVLVAIHHDLAFDEAAVTGNW